MKRLDQGHRTESIAAAAARWVARCDAGLSAEERIQLDRWLAADPRHVAALDHYASSWSVLDRGQGEFVKQTVLEKLSARARQRRHRRIQIAALAMIIFVSGAALLWNSSFRRTVNDAAALPSGVTLLEPERRVLPDGSIAELMAGTQIDVRFDDAVRSVTLLRGEAHFQVTKNPARPFVVKAGIVQARAVGTAFAVDLRGTSVDVLVTEGHVAVATTRSAAANATSAVTGSETEHLATLGIGQRISVNLSPVGLPPPQVATVSASELADRLSWRTARLEFSGTPLAEAVALMNRESSRRSASVTLRIVLDPASTDLADEPVSGLFRTDNVEAFVHVLELALGVKGERNQENEIVLSRGK